MNSKINFGVIATLIAVLALGVAIFKAPALSEADVERIVTGIQSQLGAYGTRYPNGLGVGSASMELRQNFFQASSSALFTGDATFYAATSTYGTANAPTYQIRGGVTYGTIRNAAISTTTRLCSNLNPNNATSTGVFTFHVSTGTSSAATVGVATTTSNSSATTSLVALREYVIPSGARSTLTFDMASFATQATTSSAGDVWGGAASHPIEFGPTDQMTWFLTGGTAVTYAYSYTANCIADVNSVN